MLNKNPAVVAFLEKQFNHLIVVKIDIAGSELAKASSVKPLLLRRVGFVPIFHMHDLYPIKILFDDFEGVAARGVQMPGVKNEPAGRTAFEKSFQFLLALDKRAEMIVDCRVYSVFLACLRLDVDLSAVGVKIFTVDAGPHIALSEASGPLN